MAKLLKNYLKRTFKDKKYFTTLFLFVLFLFILFLSGMSIFQNYNNIGNDIFVNRTKANYYLDYGTRTGTYANSQALNPLQLFDDGNQTISYESYSSAMYDLPSLSLEDGVIFSFSNNENKLNSELESKDFNVFDFLINQNNVSSEYIKYVSHLNLTDKINQYIMNFYQKHNLQSLFSNVFIKQRTGKDSPTIKIRQWEDRNDDNKIKTEIDDSELFDETKALQSIGQIINVEITDEVEHDSSVSAPTTTEMTNYAIGSLYQDLDVHYNYSIGSIYISDISFSSLFSLPDNDLYNNNWFDSKLQDEGYRNLDFYIAYISEVASKYHFDVSYYNSLTYSNNKINVKYLFVDRTLENEKYHLQYKNDLNLNIIDSIPYRETVKNNIIISSQFAKQNNIDIHNGASFDFQLPNAGTVKYQIVGVGYDYSNTYPLIYDSDTIPDTKHEATVFVTSDLFSDLTRIPNSFVAENSKVYFSYIGTSMDQDYKSLSENLNLNPTHSLGGTTLTDFNSLTNNLRSNVVNYFANLFLYSFLTLFIIFFIIAALSVYVLITKDIQKKMEMLGILKANGQFRSEIAAEYGFKSLIPSLIAGIFGYAIMFLFQLFINTQVSIFFDSKISLNVFFGWFLLFYFVVNAILFVFGFLVAMKHLSRGPIELINKQTKTKTKNHLLALIDKMKIKNYDSKIAAKQFAVSWKKITSLSVAIFISSMLSALVIDAPTSVATIKNNYYKNIYYNLASEYNEPTINAPLSYYTSYEDESSDDTFYPDAIKVNSTGEFISSEDYNEATNKYDTDYIFNSIVLNLITLKNKHFSINAIESMIDKLESDRVEEFMNLIFFNVFLGTYFEGSDVSSANGWQNKMGALITSRMPAELIEYWNSSDIQKKFSVDIQTTKYNNTTDTLASVVKTVATDNNLGYELYGLQDDKLLNLDLSELKNDNEVIATKKLLNSLHKKVGDTIDSKVKEKELQFISADGSYKNLEKDWWKYDINGDSFNGSDNDNDDIALDETKLDHFTFENPVGEHGTGYSKQYYLTTKNDPLAIFQNGKHYREYGNYSSIYLKIPVSELVASGDANDLPEYSFKNPEFDNLFDINNEAISLSKDKNFIIIKPYDWNYSTNYHKNISELEGYFLATKHQPMTWMDAAQSVGNGEEKRPFLSTNEVEVSTQYKIVDQIDIYDKNIAYTKSDYVNKFLKVSSKDENGWFNAKLSNDKNYADSFFRLGVSINNGDLSGVGLKNIGSIAANSDFLGKKISTIDNLYSFVVKIVVLFLIIIILISIISIMTISNIFIEQFYNTIMLFKVMGYRNSEIQKMILGIFMPLNVVTIIVGAIIPSCIILIAIKILALHGILFPLGFIYVVPIIVSILMTAMFVWIYFMNYNKFIKLNIQQQITANN